MVEFKIVVADPKTGKCFTKEVKDEKAEKLIGLKIGDKFDGNILDLPGYELLITGGSDYCGFPMKKDVEGTSRKKVMLRKGFNLRKVRKNIRKRRTVAGNTIYEKTAQINAKIIKYGDKPLWEENEEKKE